MLAVTVTDWTPPVQDAAAPSADVDRALARAAASGDSAAFESLYRRHAARVHGVVARLVGFDRARAEDLAQ